MNDRLAFSIQSIVLLASAAAVYNCHHRINISAASAHAWLHQHNHLIRLIMNSREAPNPHPSPVYAPLRQSQLPINGRHG